MFTKTLDHPGVESRDRIIQQQQLLVQHHRARDGRTTDLARVELGWKPIPQLSQAERLQVTRHHAINVPVRQSRAMISERQCRVVEHCHVAEKAGELKDGADTGPQLYPSLIRKLHPLLSQDSHASSLRGDQSRTELQNETLASAIGTQQHDELSWIDRQRNMSCLLFCFQLNDDI